MQLVFKRAMVFRRDNLWCETMTKPAKTTEQLSRYIFECPLPRVMEVVGERWSLLILRLAFVGVRNFEQFQAVLGIARNILSDRLTKLVAAGMLERQPNQTDRRRVEYHLTRKGEALIPALVALRQWGEKWEPGPPPDPVLVDARDKKPVAEIRLKSADGRELGLTDLRWARREDVNW